MSSPGVICSRSKWLDPTLNLNTEPHQVACTFKAEPQKCFFYHKFLMHSLSFDILPVTLPLNLFSFVNSKKTCEWTIHGYQK